MKNIHAKHQLKKAYQDDALEVSVYGASPAGLIVLLYQGAIQAARQSKIHMANRRYEEKTRLINKAIDIMEGLRLALDHGHNPDLSRNLEELYIYLKFRLAVANMKNDPAILDEVAGLLGVILPAWQEVAKAPPHGGSESYEPQQATLP